MRSCRRQFRRGALAGLVWLAALGVGGLDLPDFSGTWRLNKDQSDAFKSAAWPSRAPSGPGGGSGRGGVHIGGRRGGDGGAEASDPELTAALQTLVIDHKDPRLSITDALGRVRVIYTDGRKTEEEHSHGGTTKVQAEWKDGRVEIVSKPETGSKRTDDISVAADHSQLRVTIKIEGERGPTTLRLVYDALPAGAPTPSAKPAPERPAPSGPPADLPPEL
jgi:hypothetical protein